MLDATLRLQRTQPVPFHLVIAGRDVRELQPEVDRRGLQDVVRLSELGCRPPIAPAPPRSSSHPPP
jgi:hypothetical protein